MKIEKIKNSDRFAIVDDAGKVLDDANGYGYTTAQKAHKAMWYKFSGGKQKINEKKRIQKKFFDDHPGLEKLLNNILEINFKEIARGEVTGEDILEEIKKQFGVDMPKEYLQCDYHD